MVSVREKAAGKPGSCKYPNDIFNTYNFLNFDYEERPGADAAKFQYLFNDLSNVEVAFSIQKNNKYISAVRYFINKWGYTCRYWQVCIKINLRQVLAGRATLEI
ncbi:hypothetical protein Niako_3297 [Niastella koreensis GR20-10]|uniref:Uncharacterized protein n=1 Tax=Niastella koreensis (strain DSM 17620 / KACC 11465 / NBRC 106392 / GR20-10) TaxID=700598 RepID=G8TI18_NIAKG|nr:hypothetical protein Niako_3297 [Niastella koreensis GR20-10]